MKKTAFIVIIITILSKICGFLREMVLSYFYGASGITDAYLIAVSIPMVVFGFLSTGLSTAFIPIYNEVYQKNGEKEAETFTNNMANIIILFATVVVIAVYLFTDDIVRIFAKSFSGETLNLAVYFTRVSIFGIYGTILYHLYSSYLRIKNDYITPAVAGLPLNLMMIAFVIISSKTNSDLLIFGYLIGILLQFALVFTFTYKKGYKFRPVLNFKDKNAYQLLIISLPIIFGSSVNQINVMIDRTIASGVIEGGISALNYATRLNDFVQTLFVSTVVGILFPNIAKMASENDTEGMKKSVSEAMIMVFLVVIPAMFGFMIFSREIVTLLFGRGAFTKNAIDMTSMALFYYSMGMFSAGMREVLTRVFYAVKDTVTPVKNAFIAVIVKVILNLILSGYMGISGLAFATSISNVFCMILMLYSFRKKFGRFGFKYIFKETFKIFFSSIIMAIVSNFAYHLLLSKFSSNISLLIAIVIAVAVYGVSVILFKVEEVNDVLEKIKKKFLLKE